ncbi:MAG TPA: type III pantothenate kinase [Terriglobales bacterium]|nr:type III pantothenate kinase [Terriglobales bacterium]
MILAVDVGNTTIVLGCIADGNISDVAWLETNRKKTEYEYAATIRQILGLSGRDREGFEGAIISSVVPQLTATLKAALRLVTGKDVLIVGAGVKTGLNIGIDDPSEAGADLVATAVAAVDAGPPLPIIIVDMGTATTLTVVDKNRRMVGGAIIPGLAVSSEALTRSVSLLPHIPIEAPKKVIGSNSVDCMKSGAVFAAAAAIDGMIARMEEELGSPASVVATGGLAAKVVPHCRRNILSEPNLLLRGLWLIWQKNQKT